MMGRKGRLVYKALTSPITQSLFLALLTTAERKLRKHKEEAKERDKTLGQDYTETIDI